MSQVLIGIIGVILFIGLALAGALFLGPQFQNASHSSKAAAVMSSMSQVAQAVALYRVQEGVPLSGSALTDLVTRNYLKEIPGNPTGTHPPYRDYYDPGVISMYLGTNNEARDLCKAIQKQANGTETIPHNVSSPWVYSDAGGCVLNNDTYTVYQSI